MRRSLERQCQYDSECTMKTLYADFIIERAIYAILLCTEDIGLIDSTLSNINDEEIRQLTKCEAISFQAGNRELFDVANGRVEAGDGPRGVAGLRKPVTALNRKSCPPSIIV